MAEIHRSLEERVSALKNKGVADEEIVKLLISAGYHEGEIRAALAEYVPGSEYVISLPAPDGEKEEYAPTSVAVRRQAQQARAPLPKLPGFIEMFLDAFALYKARVIVLTEVFVIPVIAMALSALFLGASRSNYAASRLFWSGLSVLGYLVSVVLLLVSALAMILALRNEKMGTEEAYWKSLQNIGGYVWVALLAALAVFGGFLLGVIPAFIFGIWFAFYAYIFVDQKQTGMDALLRSKEYVTGYFWDVLWRVLLLLLAASIADALVGGVSLIFGTGVNYIASLLLQILIVPFILAFFYSLYSSLKKNKPDLADQPVKGDRSFFIFVILLGAILPFIMLYLKGSAVQSVPLQH